MDFFFYIVLDNVVELLSQEKQKMLLEKLCIAQSLTIPSCFSLIVINDALVNEITAFKKYSNIFENYMFTPFFLKPLEEQQLDRIMKEALQAKYARANIHGDVFYEEAYPNYFKALHD